ncbi:hypothetical protein ABMA27_014320 [Loxostege sticticalis]|uniref:CCHC-type domain-containing protein n=1 Tax=Loxostege sticticalis TaxID=481309 RepID=A0ABR3I8I3_LOXSC
MLRSPVRKTKPTQTRVTPPAFVADCAPAANSSLQKIQELLAKINLAIKSSGNLRRDIKQDVCHCTKEIETILLSNPSMVPNTQADPAATTAAVRLAVREEMARFKPPDCDTVRQAVREELAKFKPPEPTSVRQAMREELAKFQPSAIAPKAPSSAMTRTYAESARAPPRKAPTPPRTLPSIIIKTSKEDPNQPSVLDQWKSKVSFRDTTFAPTKVKPIGKNALRVDFESPDHCAEALKRANAVPGLKAEEARKRKPLIILKGINKDTNREELLDIIAQQNAVPIEGMRLCFPLKNRNEKLYNVVLEVQPTIYKKFIESERVNIEHQRVRAAEFSRFVQCYKCLEFGHTNNKCRADYYPCSHCASTAHSFANCPNKNKSEALKCINCTRHNEKTGSNAGTKHSATNSKICPRIIHTRNILQETVDYGF